MISILSSEGLAPSQAAPKPNKLSSNPDKSPETSEETSFSSLVSQGSSEEAESVVMDRRVALLVMMALASFSEGSLLWAVE